MAWSVAGLAVILTGGIVIAASAPRVEGDLALWELLDVDSVNAETTLLNLAVTRVGCAGGTTGALLEPRISYEADRIVIRIDAEPLGPGTFSCPGNDAVPVRVTLIEPIGDRQLEDGACSEFERTQVTLCADPVRWSPAAR